MITVTLLVKNGERCLKETLHALAHFEEIIVYDTGSTDSSLTIAASFSNVTLHRGELVGFGSARNHVASLAKHDWILCIDADEVISSDLSREIRSLSLHSDCVYAIPYHNYFNGKQIKWCGWYPERHIRLYDRRRTAFSEAMVHEGVLTEAVKEIVLKYPVNHYSYGSISDFLTKMERYSTLFAEQYQHKRRSSPAIACLHGLSAFFKSFFLKKGFLGGYEGFLISIYNGHTAFYKYLKLYHQNLKR